MTGERHFLTREGRQRLQEELNELRSKRRPEVLERLREALEAAHGDVAHSTEYAETKREQAFVEGRIAELERLLAGAQLVEAPAGRGIAGLGSTVVVKDELGEERYTLVGHAEADPRRGCISIESPVGRALLGHKQGDVVDVQTPAGLQRLELLKIE